MAKEVKTLNDIAEGFGVTWDKLTDDLIDWGYMKKSKDFKKAYADMFEWSDDFEDFIVSDEALKMIEDDDWASGYTESTEETVEEPTEENGEETSEESDTESVEDEPSVEEDSEDDKSSEDVDSDEPTEEDESGEIEIGDNPFDESVDEDDSDKE
jgi:hypothetical protein